MVVTNSLILRVGKLTLFSYGNEGKMNSVYFVVYSAGHGNREELSF
jgi:hypothetical protein